MPESDDYDWGKGAEKVLIPNPRIQNSRLFPLLGLVYG